MRTSWMILSEAIRPPVWCGACIEMFRCHEDSPMKILPGEISTGRLDAVDPGFRKYGKPRCIENVGDEYGSGPIRETCS